MTRLLRIIKPGIRIFLDGMEAAFGLYGPANYLPERQSIRDAIRSDFRRAGEDLARGAGRVEHERQGDLFDESV